MYDNNYGNEICTRLLYISCMLLNIDEGNIKLIIPQKIE